MVTQQVIATGNKNFNSYSNYNNGDANGNSTVTVTVTVTTNPLLGLFNNKMKWRLFVCYCI